MNVDERMKTLRLLEKMNSDKNFSERLGLQDMTHYHGIPINKIANKSSNCTIKISM